MHQYAAGLIDGEGYIGIQETGGSFQVRLKIAMSDKGRPALEEMARRYGGSMYDYERKNENYRDNCTWVMTGEKALEVIRKVKPWLLVKQEAAEIAVSFQLMLETADRLPNGRRKWTDEMRSKAKLLMGRIHEANRRGPDPEPDQSIKGLEPLAQYSAGHWWDIQDSLFGPEPFTGNFPANGSMRDGIVYAHDPKACSPGGEMPLLRTVMADETGGGMIHPEKAAENGQTLRLSSQLVHLVAPDQLPR